MARAIDGIATLSESKILDMHLVICRPRLKALLLCLAMQACTRSPTPPAAIPAAPAATPSASEALLGSCISSGDGYFRAHLAGAIDANIDWPNTGTHCEGESKLEPAGIRVSFKRDGESTPNLLFVIGITGVSAGAPAHAAGANLTVIEQGTSHIYGTQGDSRCTVDSLIQRPLPGPHAFRVEARGFCTSPAHAIRGEGDVLMSTFEFAGVVNFDPPSATALTRINP